MPRVLPYIPVWSICIVLYVDGSLLRISLLDELGDPQADQTNTNDEDNGENNNDTSLLLSPVLAAGELVEGVASDNGGVHGRHFEGWATSSNDRECFR